MPLLRRRRRHTAQIKRPDPPVWVPKRSVPSPIQMAPQTVETGKSTVAYNANEHTLSVKYTLEIYASLDRVWYIVLDSMWDTWNPIQ
ncbi:hypothetical protein NM688_g9116 [Phlebia brevispora]|uniref:Uncharacterized protein n=1 Tax=Phlebia brevispora TaxID=194682 RepID=A0ACC1RJ94_9APHY|nr:hypothetical protein NM688_g9116 [Phlebia brevispora]